MMMAFSAHNEISRVKTFLYGINSGNEKGNTTSDYYTICPYFVLFSFYKTIIFLFSFCIFITYICIYSTDWFNKYTRSYVPW